LSLLLCGVTLRKTLPLIGSSFFSAYGEMLAYVHGFDGEILTGCSGCDAYILCILSGICQHYLKPLLKNSVSAINSFNH
jgi:hypothetical protein